MGFNTLQDCNRWIENRKTNFETFLWLFLQGLVCRLFNTPKRSMAYCSDSHNLHFWFSQNVNCTQKNSILHDLFYNLGKYRQVVTTMEVSCNLSCILHRRPAYKHNTIVCRFFLDHYCRICSGLCLDNFLQHSCSNSHNLVHQTL